MTKQLNIMAVLDGQISPPGILGPQSQAENNQKRCRVFVLHFLGRGNSFQTINVRKSIDMASWKVGLATRQAQGMRRNGQSGQVIIEVEVGEPGLQSNSSNLHEPWWGSHMCTSQKNYIFHVPFTEWISYVNVNKNQNILKL